MEENESAGEIAAKKDEMANFPIILKHHINRKERQRRKRLRKWNLFCLKTSNQK